MNCERCRELFPEAIGEELDPRLAGELRRHLDDCADCRRELELLGRTASVLKSAWPEEPIPEPLTFGLPGRAAVAGRFGFGWGQPPRLAWLGLAAAACLVVCLGDPLLSERPRRDRPGKLHALAFGPEIPSPCHSASGAPGDSAALVEARVRRLVDRTIGRLEETWEARLQQAVAGAQSQWTEQRSVDLRQVNADLGYLLRLQQATRQETARNEVLISSVADRYLPRPADRGCPIDPAALQRQPEEQQMSKTLLSILVLAVGWTLSGPAAPETVDPAGTTRGLRSRIRDPGARRRT